MKLPINMGMSFNCFKDFNYNLSPHSKVSLLFPITSSTVTGDRWPPRPRVWGSSREASCSSLCCSQDINVGLSWQHKHLEMNRKLTLEESTGGCIRNYKRALQPSKDFTPWSILASPKPSPSLFPGLSRTWCSHQKILNDLNKPLNMSFNLPTKAPNLLNLTLCCFKDFKWLFKKDKTSFREVKRLWELPQHCIRNFEIQKTLLRTWRWTLHLLEQPCNLLHDLYNISQGLCLKLLEHLETVSRRHKHTLSWHVCVVKEETGGLSPC